MKKYFKYLLLLIVLFLFGCGKSMTPRSAVDEFFSKYIKLDDAIVDQLNSYVKAEGLTEEQEEVYKKVLRREYTNLEYDIVSEETNGDETIVNVKVKVFDLYKAQKEAMEYYKNNPKMFKSNDEFMDYKLDKMSTITDKHEYDMVLTVVKDNDGYRVKQLNNSDLEKIHGMYNYEE